MVFEEENGESAPTTSDQNKSVNQKEQQNA